MTEIMLKYPTFWGDFSCFHCQKNHCSVHTKKLLDIKVKKHIALRFKKFFLKKATTLDLNPG